MAPSANPFLDDTQIRGELYRDACRLARRTTALHTAKIAGPPVAEVITDLVGPAATATVLDIGCGRGTTTAHLARSCTPRRLVAVDQSAAVLAHAARRVEPGTRTGFVRADFHRLPVTAGGVDVIVAAFCLYHSTAPSRVIGEFARALRPSGRAVLVTKSADSYRALDDLVAATGLDPWVASRPSLYASFHSDNAAAITAAHLTVQQVIHHEHRFRFTDADHLADYLITNPKYTLPSADPDRVAHRLRGVLGPDGVTTSSTVSYIVAVRP